MSEDIFYADSNIHKPVNVTILSDYILNIEYDDGRFIHFDMEKLLNHPLFKPLKDKSVFQSVKIRGSAICWENDIDICGDSIYRQIYN